MKKICLFALFALLFAIPAHALGYNYISQDDMRDRLEAETPTIIVDICPAPQFAKGHLPGSIETNAYPTKTEEERSRLDPPLKKIKASTDQVVIVCPGGRGGAKRTYDYYMSNGVDEERLLILEKGMNGWPYQTEK